MLVTKNRKKHELFDYVNIILLTLMAITVFYPFYNSLIVSITPRAVYIKSPFMLFPTNFTLDAYKYIFKSNTILDGFQVTLFLVVVGVAYNMLLTVMTAYALAKPRFHGKNFFLNIIIFTMYFGGGLIPFYLLVRSLGLTNSLMAMILPTGINTFYMLIVRNYFQSLPMELEESAKIDGANELHILFKIILPMSIPVLATFVLFYAVDRWNEWFLGMLFIKTATKLPLQYVLRTVIINLSAVNTSNVPREVIRSAFSDGVKMACVVVIMTPIMVLYPFVQRYFMKGILVGALKS